MYGFEQYTFPVAAPASGVPVSGALASGEPPSTMGEGPGTAFFGPVVATRKMAFACRSSGGIVRKNQRDEPADPLLMLVSSGDVAQADICGMRLYATSAVLEHCTLD